MREFMTKGIEQAQKGLAETRSALRTPPPLRRAVLVVGHFSREPANLRVQGHAHRRECALQQHAPGPSANSIDSTIYRIVQEGITNAIRHGNASEIAIHLSSDGSKVAVTISDNGSGAGEIKEGMGLAAQRLASIVEVFPPETAPAGSSSTWCPCQGAHDGKITGW